MSSYDAIIVGSGQGGTPLAVKLAEEGWKTALIEKEHLGGTCVNVGCTPTKTMVASAGAADVAERSESLGVKADVTVDFERVLQRKDEIVSNFREGQRKRTDVDHLDVHKAEARFVDDRELDVDGETLTAERIVLNVGLRPMIPPIDGLDKVDYLTSTGLLDVDSLPDRLVIIGGGYVGCEFAQMFSRFGSDVTILQATDHLLDREDEDVSEEVESVFHEEGVSVKTDFRVTSVRQREGEITVEAEGDTVSGNELLVAAGRRPNTDRLNLEATDLETDDRGFLDVNDHFETGVEGVWAIGDVTGNAPFTNVSYHDHQILYEDWLEGGSERARPGERNVPFAVFTDPPVAGVGLNEKEARQGDLEYTAATTPMDHVARGIESGETDGLLKVLADPESGRILGASLMGMHADDVIHTFTALMDANTTVDVLEDMVCVHPAVSEALPVLVRKLDLERT